jgi:hypothetical protein
MKAAINITDNSSSLHDSAKKWLEGVTETMIMISVRVFRSSLQYLRCPRNQFLVEVHITYNQ